jgi:hypothetical protein
MIPKPLRKRGLGISVYQEFISAHSALLNC